MSVVEVGQYFVTRNASEFLLRSVACREYTLPRDTPHTELNQTASTMTSGLGSSASFSISCVFVFRYTALK